MKSQKAILLAGLGFGDEGKGTTVDYLANKFNTELIVRYNGGSQAAHNVVTSDGRHHCFAQFASGMFVPGVRTHLSRFMLVNPLNMLREEKYLRKVSITDAWERTSIDGEALVITPFQRSAGRIMEIARGVGRHGSCGSGVGQALADFQKYGDKVLFVKDLTDPVLVLKKLRFLQDQKRSDISGVLKNIRKTKLAYKELSELETPNVVFDYLEQYAEFVSRANIVNREYFHGLVNSSRTIIFEGAQGVLLDPVFGFKPHVTKTNITFKNAFTLLNECGFQGKVKKTGVLRSYMTRHGNGPFITECGQLEKLLPEPHNAWGPWQGKFRVGYFDSVAVNYAIQALGGVDTLVLTCLDRLLHLPEVKLCVGYTNKNNLIEDLVSGKNPLSSQNIIPVYEKIKGGGNLIQRIETLLNVPVSLASFGPTAADKHLRKTLC